MPAFTRLLLAAAMLLCATLAQASMIFTAMAMPASEVRNVAFSEPLLLAATNRQDGSTLDLDKAWQGLHYLLTGTAFDAGGVLGQAIMGGRPIGKDLVHGPLRVLTPPQVKAIASALAKVSAQQLAANYDPVTLRRAGIYPTELWANEGPLPLQYLLSHYLALQAFYARAAANGQAVVLLIS